MHYRSFNKAAYATLVVVLLLVAAAACAPDVARLQRDGEVEKLIDALAYEKDAEVRADAAEALGQMGDAQAVGPLVALLADADPEVRQEALVALGSLGAAEVIEPAIAALQDEDGQVRLTGKQVLVEAGAASVEPLIGALDRADADLCEDVQQILVEIGSPAAEPLVNALAFTATRESARQVLVQLGASAVPELIAALTSSDAALSEQAKQVLLEIGAPAVQPLVAALGDPLTKPAAAALLQEIGEPAIQPIIAALGDERLAEPAGQLLIELGTPALDALAEAVQAQPEIGAPAVEPLIAALTSDDLSLRAAAIEGLAAMGEPAVLPLIALLKENYKLIIEDVPLYANRVAYSPAGSTSGRLADGGICDETGNWGGRVVLCERGEKSFDKKVMNVQEGGGVGVVLYNNIPGTVLATLDDETEATIPAVMLTQEQGADLVANELGETARVFVASESAAAVVPNILARIGKPAIPNLIEALQDDLLAEQSGEVLQRIGTPAVSPLIKALAHPDESIRSQAIGVLGEIGSPSALSPILSMLEDDAVVVRWTAVNVLGKFKKLESIEPLVARLVDGGEDKSVRAEAASALGGIGLPAKDSLLTAYNDPAMSDLRTEIADGLRDIFYGQSKEISAAAEQVCSGAAMPGAAAYQRTAAGPHPLIILDGFARYHNWSNHLPVDWLPYTPEQLQVVVCVDSLERVVVQVCRYVYRNTGSSAPSITRYRSYREVSLYAASTGQKIKGYKLYGTQPDRCPATTSRGTTKIEGGTVGMSELWRWLKSVGMDFSGG